MEIEKLFEEEIRSEFDTLRAMELGSESYKVAVDGVTKLADRAIAIENFKAEREDKAKELERLNKQAADEKLDRRVNIGVTLLGLLLTTGVTIWGTKACFKFEETGTITSTAGRFHVGNLFRRK